jgi:hypothetical protein
MVDTVVARLLDDATSAVETRAATLAAQSESVRLHTCKGILELSWRLRAAGEFEERGLGVKDE